MSENTQASKYQIEQIKSCLVGDLHSLHASMSTCILLERAAVAQMFEVVDLNPVYLGFISHRYPYESLVAAGRASGQIAPMHQ